MASRQPFSFRIISGYTLLEPGYTLLLEKRNKTVWKGQICIAGGYMRIGCGKCANTLIISIYTIHHT